MVYTRACDQTVEADYFAAMERVEKRLELVGEKELAKEPIVECERGQLLALAEQLAVPGLSEASRLALVALLLCLLNTHQTAQVEMPTAERASGGWIPPPRSPALVSVEVA